VGPKARRFRYLAERAGPDKPKKPRRPRRDTSKHEASTADRNRSSHAARKGGVVLEDSRTKPSRKSTRRGKGKVVTTSANADGIPTKRAGEGHVKAGANLHLRAIVKARSPEQRARRKGGRRGL
jgi:hypothetical protein